MANVDDLNGPAGSLEAVLDLPADGPPDDRLRAAVVFAHPHPQLGGTMQNKVVYQAAKGLARHWMRACCGSTSVASDEARDSSTKASAKSRTSPRRSTTWRHNIPLRLWAAGFSFGSWVALETGAARRPGVRVDRHRAASGNIDLREDLRVPEHVASTKPKFLIQGEADDVCPVEAMWRFYGQLAGTQGTGRDRRRGSPVRGQDAGGRRGARRSARRFLKR